MKFLPTLILYILISIVSSPSWSETMTDLVERGGLFYKKFTNVPFTGEVVGVQTGKFKNGKKDGPWEYYLDNGQLRSVGSFKDGKEEGVWKLYGNGQLQEKGNFKEGKKDGPWEYYFENGQLDMVGSFKDGKEEGLWKSYFENEQLYSEGHYKNGKGVGPWKWYFENGELRGKTTYKNGIADIAPLLINADLENGANVFSKCKACHELEDGANKTGPHLYQIVGRPVGSVDGYRYSGAMVAVAKVWSTENLNKFLENPKSYAPGTKMGYAGLKNVLERTDLIAYLKSIK